MILYGIMAVFVMHAITCTQLTKALEQNHSVRCFVQCMHITHEDFMIKLIMLLLP